MWFQAIIRTRPLDGFTAGHIKKRNRSIYKEMRFAIYKLPKRVSGVSLMGMYTFDFFIPI
jgi:hypothetical protein